MAYVYFNPNPQNQRVGDCAVRAMCKALGQEWEDAYAGICSIGFSYADMPSSNYVWGMYLRRYGFEQKMIPSICPNCTTVSKFAKDHPKGRYVLACQNHVVCVDSGDWFDSWDSSDEIVLYYFEKQEE